jgi:hypothetical protein
MDDDTGELMNARPDFPPPVRADSTWRILQHLAGADFAQQFLDVLADAQQATTIVAWSFGATGSTTTATAAAAAVAAAAAATAATATGQYEQCDAGTVV